MRVFIHYFKVHSVVQTFGLFTNLLVGVYLDW